MGDVVYGNSTRRLGLYWLAKFGGLPCSVTTLTLPHSPRIITCKVGHAGTLDPMASGLLVICVGKATKAVTALMAERKRYTGTMKLGEATPSLDADTAVCETAAWQHVTGTIEEQGLC